MQDKETIHPAISLRKPIDKAKATTQQKKEKVENGPKPLLLLSRKLRDTADF